MTNYIKICGIKCLEDAILSLHLGASAIGVISGAIYKTEDELRPETAREILTNLPDNCKKVLVTHLTKPEEVLRLAKYISANTIQIHSEMKLSDIIKLRRLFDGTLIGVAHGNSPDVYDCVEGLVTTGVDMILIDTRTEDRVGGTGKTHDWTITQSLVKLYPNVRFILAGGLNPENVRSAIEIVQPYGVDVNSGVKAKCGYKDPVKLEEFISNALLAFHSIST